MVGAATGRSHHCRRKHNNFGCWSRLRPISVYWFSHELSCSCFLKVETLCHGWFCAQGFLCVLLKDALFISLIRAKDIIENNQYPASFYEPLKSATMEKLLEVAKPNNPETDKDIQSRTCYSCNVEGKSWMTSYEHYVIIKHHVPPVFWRTLCHCIRLMSIKQFLVVWFTISLVHAATGVMLDRLTSIL